MIDTYPSDFDCPSIRTGRSRFPGRSSRFLFRCCRIDSARHLESPHSDDDESPLAALHHPHCINRQLFQLTGNCSPANHSANRDSQRSAA